MLRTLVLLLFTCNCAFAGQVETFDGTTIDKDSAATLRVYSQIGKEHQPKTIFAFAVKIDTLRLYDRYFSGEEYSAAAREDAAGQYWNLIIDAGLADRLDKVKMDCRPHIVTVQCILRYNQLRTGEYGYSKQVPLDLRPLPGREYEVRASCEGDQWTIWIQDRKTKEVVSTATKVI